MELEGTDPDRCARRVLRALPDDAHLLGELVDVVRAADDRGLDRRNVERKLNRLSNAERTSFPQVGVARDVMPAEVGHDVHQ